MNFHILYFKLHGENKTKPQKNNVMLRKYNIDKTQGKQSSTWKLTKIILIKQSCYVISEFKVKNFNTNYEYY